MGDDNMIEVNPAKFPADDSVVIPFRWPHGDRYEIEIRFPVRMPSGQALTTKHFKFNVRRINSKQGKMTQGQMNIKRKRQEKRKKR